LTDLVETFSIPKTTGTHADVLTAVGLADLLASIPGLDSVSLIEHGPAIEVRPPRPLADEDLASIPRTPGYPYLKPNANHSVPPAIRDFVDYPAEKAKADRLGKAGNQKGKRALDPATQQLVQLEQLRADWRLLQVLNTLQGDETTNKVCQTLLEFEPHEFQKQVQIGLEALGRGESSGVGWPASLVQLFNPTAAKGYGRLKPDSTDRNDKTKEQWADPFLEWLKYRGYFRVACPYFLGSKAEHVRLLCPIPSDISVRSLERVVGELRKRGAYGGSVKLDTLAVLRLADLLIRHSLEYHAADAEPFPGLSVAGKSPARLISGVTVTHYQSMGSAKAVSAMATLALPDWFPIANSDDAQAWLAILDEHQKVIRSLRDDRSDEIGLLIAYRRFLEKRGDAAVWALVEFMERYGAFVMGANGRKEEGRTRWIRRFTDQHFRRILMGTDQSLAAIIDDPGFQAVARAVRQATVTAQNRRARNDPNAWREVRYELLHDIHRTRKVPGTAFIEAVTEFISRYNYENARRREMTKDLKTAPANVSVEELKAFTTLVDERGASVVGALLAAYGTCKEQWEPEDQEDASAPEQSDDSSTQG
jgi:hypothetical protein